MKKLRSAKLFLCAAWAATIFPLSDARSQTGERLRIGGLEIDQTEVSIADFSAFARSVALVTAAEQAGGGFEYAAGWERRPGWSVYSPFGESRVSPAEPAVHVTLQEAVEYCRWRGGRLPNLQEWRQAAFSEQRVTPTDGFEPGRTYLYASGDNPTGMNTRDADPWPRHAPVGATKRGVNGLYDMGGNVWEWLADRRGSEALTAGGSWWYGPQQTTAEAPQWKPADFYAVYVGFRCVYDAPK